MAIFPTFFFRHYRLAKCILLYSITKKSLFLAIETRSSKSRKNDIFPKGLTYGFGPKMAFFHPFFLGTLSQENVFYDILERKNAFLGYKNKKFKKLKNWQFFKGVNPWFWYKNGHCSNFFFSQYRPGKCLLWYCRTRKRLSRL